MLIENHDRFPDSFPRSFPRRRGKPLPFPLIHRCSCDPLAESQGKSRAVTKQGALTLVSHCETWRGVIAQRERVNFAPQNKLAEHLFATFPPAPIGTEPLEAPTQIAKPSRLSLYSCPQKMACVGPEPPRQLRANLPGILAGSRSLLRSGLVEPSASSRAA